MAGNRNTTRNAAAKPPAATAAPAVVKGGPDHSAESVLGGAPETGAPNPSPASGNGDETIDPKLLDITPADVAAAMSMLLVADAGFIKTVGVTLINDPQFLEAIRLQLTPPDPLAEAQEAQVEAAERKAKDAKADAKRVERQAAALAKDRQNRKDGAADAYATLMFGEPHGDIDLAAVRSAGLQLGDGESFSIDFGQAIEISDLSLNARGDVVLTHAAIAIGEGMAEAFTVTELVLILAGLPGELVNALSCPLLQPLTVGGGMTAKIGENSLVFRRRYVAKAAPGAEAAGEDAAA